jgi:NMD protein affecting ribosome stability and mRNA decay
VYYYDKDVKLNKIKFGVTNMICPMCGKNHTGENKNLCGDCRAKLGVR